MLAKTRAKMTKIEQLKAAYEAATPGEWVLKEQPLTLGDQVPAQRVTPTSYTDGGPIAHVFPFIRFYPPNTIDRDITQANATFIALAHNLMPTLLEAIDLLETVSSARACQDHEFDVDAWFKQMRSLLEKLK